MARAPEVQQIHSNFLETLIFKGLASPIALILIVVQGRYLHTGGRGSFVLVVLSVTILTRLLGQLGYAVTSRAQKGGVDLRQLVQASFAIGLVLGVLGTAAIIAWGAASADIGWKVAAIAAAIVESIRGARRDPVLGSRRTTSGAGPSPSPTKVTFFSPSSSTNS